MSGALLIPLAFTLLVLSGPSATTDAGGTRAARLSSAPSLGPAVTIEAENGETFPASYDVADALESSTVLQMRVTGFEPNVSGFAQQCAPSEFQRCANVIPVRFDARGEARFQYLVTDHFLPGARVPGRCRSGAAPCTIIVADVDRHRRGEIQTVFGDRVAPAGHIAVTPSDGLSLDGETVRVDVRDYPAGVRVTAVLCAAPDAIGRRCGRPGPSALLVVGPDGTGRTRLRIEPGPVGGELAPCSRGDDCGVSVASNDVFARAPVVPISFAAPPGAAYDLTRLFAGLGLAGLLLLIATGLIWRSDWSAVGEAAAPEIDDAEYADLDAIIAALPPEPEEPVPSR